MKVKAGIVIPIALTVIVPLVWWMLWYRPQSTEVASLRREVSGLVDRSTQLVAELARLRSEKPDMVVVSQDETRERWKLVAAILEEEGFRVGRVELGSTPGGIQAPGQGVPGGAAPLPQQSGVQVPEIRLSIRFEGDYLKLLDALERVVEEIPGAGWVRLEIEGQGTGTVSVDADLRMLGVSRRGGV